MLNGDVRIVEVVSPPDANGVYQAVVEIKRPDGQWVIEDNKTGANAMFPSDWSREKSLMRLIQRGKIKEHTRTQKKWEGTSRSGVSTEGYKELRITAFPACDERR